jgi:hypothetical protein
MREFLQSLTIRILLIIPNYIVVCQPLTGDSLTIPYIEKDVCPFECCQFGLWVSKSVINVYANENDTSQIAFTISPNDTIIAETGNYYVKNFGKVVITRDISDFQIGDTLFVIRCVGEGWFIVSFQNEFRRVYYYDILWRIKSHDDDLGVEFGRESEDSEYSGIMIEEPHAIWWVKIKNTQGTVGWLRLVNKSPICFEIEENIWGMDSCG